MERIAQWEKVCIQYLSSMDTQDGAHDLSHTKRVWNLVRKMAEEHDGIFEELDMVVLVVSSYLHDIISLPKDHPERHASSELSANKAREFLASVGFPEEKLRHVHHAILAHSFSAKVPPETPEAFLLQDSDRLDALGALGILRTFYVSGFMNRIPYDPIDPFHTRRPLDDRKFGLDHFFSKLFLLQRGMKTSSGEKRAKKRTDFMRAFIAALEEEISSGKEGDAYQIVWESYDAGKQRKSLIHHDDPLCHERSPSPEAFLLDTLCRKYHDQGQLFHEFFEVLSKEITGQA